MCISCQKLVTNAWCRSWNGEEGKLCVTCSKRYESHKVYCKNCNFVPYDAEIRKGLACTKCTPKTACISCEATESAQWLPSWDPDQKLCQACGTRYEKRKSYCSECRFVPYYRQTQCKCANPAACISCMRSCSAGQERRDDDKAVAQDPPSIDNPTINLSDAGELQEGSRSSRGGKAGPSGPCIAYGTTKTVKWCLSWDIEQGVLCNACGKCHMRYSTHCTLCAFIPNKREWEKMKITAKKGEQGEQIFLRPTCSRQTGGDEYTVVWTPPPDKDSPRICFSCGENNTLTWHQSWEPGQMLCNPCGISWKKMGMHCDCGYIPFKLQLSKVPSEDGSQNIQCKKCEKMMTVYVPN